MSSPSRADDRKGFVDLFDGTTLDGWYAAPRLPGSVWPGGPEVMDVYDGFAPDYAEKALAYPAHWAIVDGTIEGFQDPAHLGYGGYLVTEKTYGDFELELEMNPDWPADTGVMIRRRPDSWHGFQVLVDHRRSGSIGGFFGNGLASFHAVPYALDVATDSDGRQTGLVLEDPGTSLEPATPEKRAMLAEAGDPQPFLDAWQWRGWNHLRIRCVGRIPTITTWVNGVHVATLDAATIDHPHYDAEQVADLLGPAGHIALEVHDNDPGMADARWASESRCRWRNLKILDLTTTDGVNA